MENADTSFAAGVRENQSTHGVILNTIPVSRLINPVEIANTTVCLVNDAAAYVTGRTQIADKSLEWCQKYERS